MLRIPLAYLSLGLFLFAGIGFSSTLSSSKPDELLAGRGAPAGYYLRYCNSNPNRNNFQRDHRPYPLYNSQDCCCEESYPYEYEEIE